MEEHYSRVSKNSNVHPNHAPVNVEPAGSLRAGDSVQNGLIIQHNHTAYQAAHQAIKSMLDGIWKSFERQATIREKAVAEAVRFYCSFPFEVQFEATSASPITLQRADQEPENESKTLAFRAATKNHLLSKKRILEQRQQSQIEHSGESVLDEIKFQGNHGKRMPQNELTANLLRRRKERLSSHSLISLEKNEQAESPVIKFYRDQLSSHLKTEYEARQEQIGKKLRLAETECSRAPSIAPITNFAYGYSGERIAMNRTHMSNTGTRFADARATIMEVHCRCETEIIAPREYEPAQPLVVKNNRDLRSWRSRISKDQQLICEDQNDILLRKEYRQSRDSGSALKSMLVRVLQEQKTVNLTKTLKR